MLDCRPPLEHLTAGISISIPELSRFATWKLLKKLSSSSFSVKLKRVMILKELVTKPAGAGGRFVIVPNSVVLREFNLFSYLLFFLPLVFPWLPVGV